MPILFILPLFLSILLTSRPNGIVQKITNQVQATSQASTENEETNPLFKCENLQHWIHPVTGHVVDELNPQNVAKTQKGSDGKSYGPVIEEKTLEAILYKLYNCLILIN